MGQWSHRRHRTKAPTPLNYITKATLMEIDQLEVTYHYPVDVLATNFGDFISNPSFTIPTSSDQLTNHSIRLFFPTSIETDTDITYNGDTPHFLTPQTILYSPP